MLTPGTANRADGKSVPSPAPKEPSQCGANCYAEGVEASSQRSDLPAPTQKAARSYWRVGPGDKSRLLPCGWRILELSSLAPTLSRWADFLCCSASFSNSAALSRLRVSFAYRVSVDA